MPSRRAYDGLRLLPRPATFVTTSKRAPIPVNIVSGPLGVGKTTTVRHLLSLRPKGERWALLVNEYGLVGLDAALMEQPAELGMALPGAPREGRAADRGRLAGVQRGPGRRGDRADRVSTRVARRAGVRRLRGARCRRARGRSARMPPRAIGPTGRGPVRRSGYGPSQRVIAAAFCSAMSAGSRLYSNPKRLPSQDPYWGFGSTIQRVPQCARLSSRMAWRSWRLTL